MLGKIYKEKGWKGKAIENYEKFIDLWKDSDPGFPEVEDAKKRLTALRNLMDKIEVYKNYRVLI